MQSEQKLNISNQLSNSESKKSVQRMRWRKEKNSGPPIFISKTYEILQNNQYHDVISWNDQGTNFVILDVDRFQDQVLPRYFRHRNFSSFVRQLNMYDFHKIRNELNRNIFEHKEFKKDQQACLRNIKRKGGHGKKQHQSEELMSISEHDDIGYEPEESYRQEDKYHRTLESIEKIGQDSPITSIRVIHAPSSPTPQKKRKMDEFISSLPQIIETEEEIHNKINQLKKDPNYECLHSKKDIRNLITRIRRKLPKREQDEDLEELSIEEEIIAEKIDGESQENVVVNPTLAVLSTEKFLPKSINLIGSFNFCQDAQHLFYQKLF